MTDEFERDLEEALTRYSQEMHDYTLQLWSDSRRAVEEQKTVKTVGRKKTGKSEQEGGRKAVEGGRYSPSKSLTGPSQRERSM